LPCRSLPASISCGLSAEALIDVGTNDASVELQVIARALVSAGTHAMTRFGSALTRFSISRLAGLAAALFVATALAQVPIPVQEQVRLFNSLPPAQQQSLIRELQSQLPPAQRDAIVNILQGQRGGQAGATQELDPSAAAALQQALETRTAGGAQAQTREPRLKPRDTLVIEFAPRKDDPRAASRTADERQKLDEFQERLAKGNPYQLDGLGTLYLPGVPAIPMAGLKVDEATIRLQAETALSPFSVTVTFLPLEPVGTAALKPFGYDLFERPLTTFASSTDIPVPADYVIGPGDTVNVQLFGNQNNEYFLTVSREGTINFPELGPLNVSGQTFTQMRDTINERVAQQMIGVRASITLGELRSIGVFVLGDVVRPGSYSVRGLATITSALYASGGVKTIGSLRNIALRRNGTTVGTLDLYDLLLRGDTRGDVRLQAGDAIFVPPIGPKVTVDGEVRRPALYEVKNEESVAELVALAGGLNANANRAAVKLERVVPNRGTTVQDIDLDGVGARSAVRDGDVLRVPPNLQQLESSVRLAGNVFQPGLYQWRDGMRLRDLIPAPELVKPLSDLNYVLIRREVAPNVNVQVVSADLQAAWQNPTSAANVALQPRDTVYVFNIETGRQQVIEPIVAEMKAQAAPNAPVPIVRVGGQVRAEGEYPLEPGMRVSDLLRAGGGLSEAAYATDAELTRYAVVNGEYRETELVTVNLASLLRGNAAADLMLSPYDYLSVKEVSRWRGAESITLRGEVVFPGRYPIRRGETLSSVLQRAGGLTDQAFPQGSVFTRVALRQREQQQLETLARRIERDLATLSVSEPSAAQAITTGQSLITQLRNAVATGRLVIKLDDVVAGVMAADVVLEDGDQLIVPVRRQEVTVLGEVQYPTSHVFERGLGRDDYIAKSGGLAQRADGKRIYVVRANGAVVAEARARWFQRGAAGGIEPGDTVVVPLKVDQPLARWSQITQIIYNLAIAATAVTRF
jgi:polysaccharide biosynthesis/export protein